MKKIKAILGEAARQRLLYRVFGILWNIYERISGLVILDTNKKFCGGRHHRRWELFTFIRIASRGGFEPVTETPKTHGLRTLTQRALIW